MKYTYTFDQLRDNEANMPAMFRNFEYMQEHGGVDQSKYFTADSGTIEAETPQQACEKLFRFYNARCNLTGYAGRSMSVSDIVNLWDNEQNPPKKDGMVLRQHWICETGGVEDERDFIPRKSGQERQVALWNARHGRL